LHYYYKTKSNFKHKNTAKQKGVASKIIFQTATFVLLFIIFIIYVKNKKLMALILDHSEYLLFF